MDRPSWPSCRAKVCKYMCCSECQCPVGRESQALCRQNMAIPPSYTVWHFPDIRLQTHTIDIMQTELWVVSSCSDMKCSELQHSLKAWVLPNWASNVMNMGLHHQSQ